MRWSEILLPTLKEVPAEAEVASHILMIRAGLIRKLASGVYSFLPLGLKVLKKVEKIIRQEMDAKGAQEVLLPAIQPVELWLKSGRFESLGEDMIKFTDRHKKLNVLGPTHEEVITTLVKNEISSYRQLPLIIYQIQTKFRDEARPRFGIVRSREFIMKDAYSFNRNRDDLDESYQKMYDAYCRIFRRCGLKFIPVEADPGVMGGDLSHEFMVLAANGEDRIVRCLGGDYAASIDKAECPQIDQRPKTKDQRLNFKELEMVSTPGVSSVKEVAGFLKVASYRLVKTLIYLSDGKSVAVLIRGDHDLNETKLGHALKSKQLIMADEKIIRKVTKGPLGFSGPRGLKGIPIVVDQTLKNEYNFIVGANKPDAHFINVNFDQDFKVTQWADLRNITESDSCPKCGGKIEITQAIEVGHVFKLGTKYTDSFNVTYLNEQGKSAKIIMGCYGIGVTRIIAAYIEQNYDQDGIIWSPELSPFQVLIMLLNSEHELSKAIAVQLYEKLKVQNIEVLLDDRNIRAGMKFKDADLIGIPIQVVIGEKSLKSNCVEIKLRRSKETFKVEAEGVVNKIIELLQA